MSNPIYRRVVRALRAIGEFRVVTIMSGGLAIASSHSFAQDQSTSPASDNFEKYSRMLREKALLRLEPSVTIPTANRPPSRPKYPWKSNIVTTTFWVGKGNSKSAWDANWMSNFGGADEPDPAKRRGFTPAAFTPRQNPFYCELPYNDVGTKGTKPEARTVIPWFKETFVKEGQSVCRDRWVRIRNRNGKDCYAQWSDCGPFLTDHWQYVFGDERPQPNLSQGAGIETSPAVRDYLGLRETDVTDWQFVDFKDVPRGPWSLYGENNPFVQKMRTTPKSPVVPAPAEGPRIKPNF